MDDEAVEVQVCYACPDAQYIRALNVPTGTTLYEAIIQSGILAEVPAIDLSRAKVGVHGKLKNFDTAVRKGDRIEIYRPLVADPKEARRRRARARV